jgi:hypothetical protein
MVPADHLNKIFVNMSKKEQANSPRYVRNTRHEKILSSSESESEEDDFTENKDLSSKKSCGFESTSSDNQHQNNEADSDSFEFRQISIGEIKKRVPVWGARIWYQFEKKNVFVSNTCSIDYFHFALWLHYKIIPDFLSKIPNIYIHSKIVRIVELIDIIKWNEAKEIWINEVMQLTEESIRNTISLFGSNMIVF